MFICMLTACGQKSALFLPQPEENPAEQELEP